MRRLAHIAAVLAALPSLALAECTTLAFGSAAQLALVGSTGNWVSTSNALASDNSRAIGPAISGSTYTPYLRFSAINTGLLYDGVTIDGVSFTWEGQTTVTGAREYSVVAITDTSGIGTEDKASYSFSTTSTDQTVTKGSSTDDWGVGFCYTTIGDCEDPAAINLADDDAGFAIAFQQTGGTTTSVRIDYAEVEVCFTGDGTPTPTSTPTATPTATPTPTPTQTNTPVADWTCEPVAFRTPASSVDQGGAAGTWSSPSNAIAEDGSRAQSASLTSDGQYTQRLYLRNLDVAATGIADGDVVLGLSLTYNGQVTSTAVVEHEVYVVDGSAAIAGDNRARPTPYASTSTDADRTRGAEFDRWGAEWCVNSGGACADPGAVNLADQDTGVQLSFRRSGAGSSAVQRVDSASLVVCYGPPPPPTATPTPANTPTPTITPATSPIAVDASDAVASSRGAWSRYSIASDDRVTVVGPGIATVATDVIATSDGTASLKLYVGAAMLGEYHLRAGAPLALTGSPLAIAPGDTLSVQRSAGTASIALQLRTAR